MPPPSARASTGPLAARIWGLVWRMLLVIVLGILAFGISWDQYLEPTNTGAGPMTAVDEFIAVDLLLGLAAIALYPLRRRWPLPIVTIIAAVAGPSSFAAGAVAFAFVSLATRRRRQEIAIVSVVFVTSSTVSASTFLNFIEPIRWWQNLLLAAGLNAVLVITGLYIGGRRQLVTVLRERAEQIQREHDLRLEAAAMAERTRIARDLHDALAHRLSLVALHAGVLEYRADLSPEQARTTAGVVRENAHLAASDLREVLGVLRDPHVTETTGITRAPHSTLEAVELFVRESRATGNPTTLTVSDAVAAHVDDLLPNTRGHLQRVIQEGLTNARKHAPGQRVALHLGGSPGEMLSISLTNPLSASATRVEPVTSGFGIMGLQERVSMAGGGLTVSENGGCFTVEAWFPWLT